MANIISIWLGPNNFAVLRDKINAIVEILSGGSIGQVYAKYGSGDGEANWFSLFDLMPTGQPWKTYVTNLTEAPFNGKWIALDGKTLSNSSGTGDYKGDVYKALFLFIWDHFDDSVCPVSGGRGVDALTDYNANKKITIPDKRGTFDVGYDSRVSDPTNGRWDADYNLVGKTKNTIDTEGEATLTQSNLPSGVMLGSTGGGLLGGYTINPSPGSGSYANAKIIGGANDGYTVKGNEAVEVTIPDVRPPMHVINEIIKL